MIAVILGLVIYFCWGAGDIFGAISSRKIGALQTSFGVAIIGFILATLSLPFVPHHFSSYTPALFFLNVILALFAIAGNVSLNYGLRNANAAIVGTIGGSFVAFVVIFSALFFGTPVSVFEWVAILVIMTGVFLSSITFGDLKNTSLLDKSFLYGSISMLSWAICFTFVKPIINVTGWFAPMYITIILSMISLFFVNSKKNLLKNNYSEVALMVFLCALLLRMGDFLFNFSIGKNLISVVAPIAGAYPTFFVLLSFYVFKDKITKSQTVGILITLAGIVLLSAFSSY